MDELKWARRVLGVPAHANKEQVRGAFRSAAKLHHPDAGGSPAGFTEIRRAYEIAYRSAPLLPRVAPDTTHRRPKQPMATQPTQRRPVAFGARGQPKQIRRETFPARVTPSGSEQAGKPPSRSFADILAQQLGYA